MSIDNKDKKIIDQLKKDSRASIRNIAKATGIRPSTVHQRINKLKETNTIEKFTVKLNNKLVDENFIVFMFVSTEKDLDPVVFQDSHIKEVFGITGEYDLLFKLKFKDVEDFNNFILEFRKRTGVKKTITMVATVTLKEEI
ncbi:MAG: Lrp/AsnC family transcriptional regulator [Nanoarchaeota archaeon]|nr:Lrp/AsnC family transcriptional regulator [DPANN group archaeon]MBL7116255.1 Lrp/AsnC family transcriptional regulator [Nanoarchaeota archaeon]